jgi:hypothetical protein
MDGLGEFRVATQSCSASPSLTKPDWESWAPVIISVGTKDSKGLLAELRVPMLAIKSKKSVRLSWDSGLDSDPNTGAGSVSEPEADAVGLGSTKVAKSNQNKPLKRNWVFL